MHTTQVEIAPPSEPSTRSFLPIRRILCPVDFSELSRAAVVRTVAVAGATKAGITALFVMPCSLPPVDATAHEGTAATLDVGVASALTEDLLEFFRPARDAGLDLQACVKIGDSVAQILEQAEVREADLIVMGTHGRSGLERLVLGSVTTGVIRKAPCPVLTVSRAGAAEALRPGTSVGTILCALDLSEASADTMSYALELGRSMGEAVVLLHVLDGSRGIRARARVAADARQRMHAAALAENVRVSFEEMVLAGKPAREIARVAERRQAGLIVVGGGGILGSTAGALARGATVPVITVPHRP